MADAEDFAELERYLAAYLTRLGPAQRKRVAHRIGQELRRANARRIAANVQPDGSSMEPRKRRKRLRDRAGKVRRTAKMFPKIRLAKSMRVRSTPDDVEVGFYNAMIASTARAHQFGLTDFVGRTADGRTVRTRYPVRVLLGFSEEDREVIIDTALKSLES